MNQHRGDPTQMCVLKHLERLKSQTKKIYESRSYSYEIFPSVKQSVVITCKLKSVEITGLFTWS
jgi:hypothetical protein